MCFQWLWWCLDGDVEQCEDISQLRRTLIQEGDIAELRSQLLLESSHKAVEIGVEDNQLTQDGG